MNGSMLYPDYLPRCVEIGGAQHRIRWHYYIALAVIKLLRETPPDVLGAVNLLYVDVPNDLSAALEGLVQFLRGGGWSNGYTLANSEDENALDWDKDAAYIWAGMRQAYPAWDWQNKDNPAHWWEFRAAFEALPATSKIKEIMRIRVMKPTKDMSAEERQNIEELKKLYSLEQHDDEPTAAEIEAHYIEMARKQVKCNGG